MKIFIFDVRTPEEYKGGYVEGAINLPIDELLNRSELALSMLKEADKENDQIQVYCASGARSSMAVSVLEFMQYKNVVNLGGIS